MARLQLFRGEQRRKSIGALLEGVIFELDGVIGRSESDCELRELLVSSCRSFQRDSDYRCRLLLLSQINMAFTHSQQGGGFTSAAALRLAPAIYHGEEIVHDSDFKTLGKRKRWRD